ncbi:MAG: alpha/beta hydrolase [Gorillibacterium sp.]|nr:alpha/beta hydrolase [Gorillibacterium sp.]
MEYLLEGSVVILVVLGAILLGAGSYFYNYAILRKKKTFMQSSPDLEGDKGWTEGTAWFESTSYERKSLLTKDGLHLYAYELEAPKPTDKIVILVHGYDSLGKGMGVFARFYHEELGYHVVMPDLRGHGESEGNYVGFGWHDRMDLLQWIEHVIASRGEDCQILLHGVSMGAGTVLMTSGEALPDQVKGIIADCSYSSVRDILSYQMKRMFKLPAFPLIPVTSLVCRKRAGYFFSEASAVKQVQKAKKPILFIHGEADTFVPAEMAHTLYAAAEAPEKRLFLVPGAGHAKAFFADREGYTSQLKDFLVPYMT